MNVILVNQPDTAAMYAAAQVCRNSSNPTQALEGALDAGHYSLLEHLNFSFKITGVSRALTHQLVRHRIASYCLAGDTELIAYSPIKGRRPKRWTIEQLYQWSQDSKRKSRLALIRLRSVNTNNIIVPGVIKQIISSGKQQVINVTTATGRQIKATAKHKFLTKKGWKRLQDITLNDHLACNGLPAYQNKEWLYDQYIIQNKQRKDVAKLAGVSDSCLGQWIRKFKIQKSKKDYPNRQAGWGVPGMFSEEQKIKFAVDKQKDKNSQWKQNTSDLSIQGGYTRTHAQNITKDQCSLCGSLDKLEIHHIDKNPTNIIKNNLQVVCQMCHKQIHQGQAVTSIFYDKIISIESQKIENTYDIEMQTAPHNFVANGFIVHNSQESQRHCIININSIEWYIAPKTAVPLFHTTMQVIGASYLQCIEEGMPPEDARYLLPNGCMTKIILTMNARSLDNFFTLRCCKRAQWEIRDLAWKMLKICKTQSPYFQNKTYPNCNVCKEPCIGEK